jgi:phosphoglucosamine mutase
MQKLSFGTDGIRGNANEFPFTDKALKKLGQAIAQWSIKKYKKQKVSLLLGHDTRISCARIKQDLEDGFHKYGIDITDAGVVPTPAVLQLIQSPNDSFDFGIVISASHNPYTDNGIKIFDATTGKLTAKDEQTIAEFFEAISDKNETKNHYPLTPWKNASKTYEENILKLFKKNIFAGIHVVLDCANGATYKNATNIFKTLGATVTTINNSPNGENINFECGALHPEQVQKAILKNNADIGFAFDGDGDRIIAVNKNGEIKDGDDLLSVILSSPEMKNETHVVGTIMTNHGFDKYLSQQNKKLERTKVGDKYVAARLEENNWLLGGEASGHIIIKSYLNSGDGIFVAIKTLETMLLTNNMEMKTFKKYPQLLINVPVKQKQPLDQDPYKTIIADQEQKLENGRIIVRYSGTENLLRVMVEDCQYDSTYAIAHELSDNLQNALKPSEETLRQAQGERIQRRT